MHKYSNGTKKGFTPQLNAVQAIFKECLARQLPVSYQGDVYIHDFDLLMGRTELEPPVEFGWRLGNTGTAIYRPESRDSSYIVERDGSYRYCEDHYFWWDGIELLNMPANDVASKLRATYGRYNQPSEVLKVLAYAIDPLFLVPEGLIGSAKPIAADARSFQQAVETADQWSADDIHHALTGE